VLNNNKDGDNDQILFGGGHRFRVCLVFFSFFFYHVLSVNLPLRFAV
jgi:hypothetical protein